MLPPGDSRVRGCPVALARHAPTSRFRVHFRRALRQELRQLVKEERQRQTKAVYEVLSSSQASPPWRRLYSSGSQLHECCGDAFSDAAPHNNPGRVLHSVGGPRQGFEEGELRFGGGR